MPLGLLQRRLERHTRRKAGVLGLIATTVNMGSSVCASLKARTASIDRQHRARHSRLLEPLHNPVDALTITGASTP